MSASMHTVWAWLNSCAICDESYDSDSDTDLGEICGEECDAGTNGSNNTGSNNTGSNNTGSTQMCECGCGCRVPPTYAHPECGDTRLRPGRQSGADEPAKYGGVCPPQVN